jgi:hypothetical protein
MAEATYQTTVKAIVANRARVRDRLVDLLLHAEAFGAWLLDWHVDRATGDVTLTLSAPITVTQREHLGIQ